MRNPSLISEDIGVGVNVRKLRRFFLRLWKVFYDDKDGPGRCLLAKGLIIKADAEDHEIIFGNVEKKAGQNPTLLSQAAGILSSLNRFMKAISK